MSLFQVTTPTASPWIATIGTPEGDEHDNIDSEPKLHQALADILQRQRTKEILTYMLSLAP